MDVVEGVFFFFPRRLLWMVPAQMACHRLAIAACVLCFPFHSILFASYLFLCVEYATPKARDEQSVLIFNLMIHWVPLCVGVVRTLILTRVFTG